MIGGKKDKDAQLQGIYYKPGNLCNFSVIASRIYFSNVMNVFSSNLS